MTMAAEALRPSVAMDPFLRNMLDAKSARVACGDYHPLSSCEIENALGRVLVASGRQDCRIENVKRMAGGASKEQFVFTLVDDAASTSERLVLRMDPLDGVLETSRAREAQILTAMRGIVPVPEIRFADLDGQYLGAPGLITSFVSGVTKPKDALSGVSGLGTGFNARWRDTLSPQFVDNLAKIHAVDLDSARLPDYGRPAGHSREAAEWEVNLWSSVWLADASDGCPIVAITESWLRDNLPICDEPVLVHGDYRTGNYLFDETSGEITAILDWELAHVGDFHQDIALSLVEIFGRRAEDGTSLCSSLMSQDDLIDRYERATGRSVNRKTLLFYHVLSSWSLLIMGRATGLRAAAARHNHQDILLTWLSMVAHPLTDELARLIMREDKQ